MRSSSAAALNRALMMLRSEASLEEQELLAYAEQFFALADLGKEHFRLAKALTDPARSVADKESLFFSICQEETVDELVRKINRQLFSMRFSCAYDLVNTWEELGLEASLLAANESKILAKLQEELFEVNEFIKKHRELRQGLSDRKARGVKERLELAEKLFADSIAPATLILLKRAIQVVSGVKISGEHRSLDSQLRYYQDRLVELKGAKIAVVQSAIALTPAHLQRLQGILMRKYAAPVVLNVKLNPDLIGGMQIKIGAEVYDGSVATVLHQTKDKLAG